MITLNLDDLKDMAANRNLKIGTCVIRETKGLMWFAKIVLTDAEDHLLNATVTLDRFLKHSKKDAPGVYQFCECGTDPAFVVAKEISEILGIKDPNCLRHFYF